MLIWPAVYNIAVVCDFCTQDHCAENEALGHAIRQNRRSVFHCLDPSVRDALHSRKLIGDDDYRYLCNESDLWDCARYIMLLLSTSTHPRAFVEFRLVLLDQFPEVVKEIDELKSQTTQQQPDEERSADGKLSCQ